LGNRKIESIVPVFFGCLTSLVFCALLSGWYLGELRGNGAEPQIAVFAAGEEPFDGTGDVHFFVRASAERRDIIQELYREPESRDRVIDFFAEVCASREIAVIILANADAHDIAPALAVALAWEESRLDPLAVNTKNRNESIDRGLFQLNSRAFPRLDQQSFFNPELNARHGMNHLRYCLEIGGSEAAALAMYNAGPSRVRELGTPKTTLDYISRILENRWEIESQFRETEARYQEQLEEITRIAEGKPERPRLVPLMPLAGK